MGLLLHILQRMNNFPVIYEMLLDRELLLDSGSVSNFELCHRTLFENHQKCLLWTFSILAFSTKFCHIKIVLSVNTVLNFCVLQVDQFSVLLWNPPITELWSPSIFRLMRNCLYFVTFDARW